MTNELNKNGGASMNGVNKPSESNDKNTFTNPANIVSKDYDNEALKDSPFNSSSKTSRDLFETESHRKRNIAFTIIGLLGILLFIGYGITRAGHGPVAGVSGIHKVCTVQDMSLSYAESDGSEQHLGNDEMKTVTVKTRDCGVLTIDKKHLSNIDDISTLYQKIDNGKTYEFVVQDNSYINHVNISL